MIVRIRPTSFGLFPSNGRICLILAFAASDLVCAAALRTDSVLTYGDNEGRVAFDIVDKVERATPEYFNDCRSIVYLFLFKILAWCSKCFSVCDNFGAESKILWVKNGLSLAVEAARALFCAMTRVGGSGTLQMLVLS